MALGSYGKEPWTGAWSPVESSGMAVYIGEDKLDSDGAPSMHLKEGTRESFELLDCSEQLEKEVSAEMHRVN